MKKLGLINLNIGAIFENENTLYKYVDKRGLINMRKFTKKLSAITLCTLFASMQMASATIETGLNNAVINHADGGFQGVTPGVNSATLNFNANSHVNWDTLNVANGETLNFNALPGANGLTVVNTVNTGMSQIYGTVNSNAGIAKLIISNPNGMLFDGSTFTTAGDLNLTTQPLNVDPTNITFTGVNTPATQGVVIRNSNFDIGGEFNITAPSIEAVLTAVKAQNGFKLVTQDGQNYLVRPADANPEQKSEVRMETVSVDGNVYVVSGKGITKLVKGGDIKGSLNIESDGNVAVNYVDGGQQLQVRDDMNIASDGRTLYAKNVKVGGNVDMSNSGGFLEIGNVDVTGNVDLKTTVATNQAVKHFVHVIGDNEIGGNLNVDSIHNVHVGGYDIDNGVFQPGHVNVGGDANILAREGSVTVTIDTKADKMNLESGTLNILTDGKALLTANEYKFKANNYIGGVTDSDYLINVMENYLPIPVPAQKAFVQINGGNVNKIETSNNGFAFIRSKGDMNVDGVNASKVNLASDQHDIVIGNNVHADTIVVDGETKNLTVALPNRDYRLKYTDIKDTEVITINPETEITYDMANGENGWNKGTQTADNTYLVVPGDGPQPPVTPDVPDNSDNVRILNTLVPDQLAAAIDANQAYTPVAYAADLDEDEDTGVRKNVDGSVTVVRPYTPSN